MEIEEKFLHELYIKRKYGPARVCHLKKKKEFLKRIDKRFQGLFLFNFLKVPNSSYGMVL